MTTNPEQADTVPPLSEYRPATALRQPEWSEYVWRLEQELATARQERDVLRDTLKTAEDSERALQLDLMAALEQRDERPAGRVALHKQTYRHLDSLEFSALNVSGHELPYPPGTEVAVVVVADDRGEDS